MNHAIFKDPSNKMPGGIPLHILRQVMIIDLAIVIRRSFEPPTKPLSNPLRTQGAIQTPYFQTSFLIAYNGSTRGQIVQWKPASQGKKVDMTQAETPSVLNFIGRHCV